MAERLPHPFGHEPSGINIRSVLLIGALFAITVIVVTVAIEVSLTHWVAPQHTQVVTQSALAPPKPRLQAHPQNDLAEFRAHKMTLLETWHWTDPTHAFARIPIDRAMTMLAQPAPARVPANTNSRPAQADTPSSKSPSHRTDAAQPASVLRAPKDLLQQVRFEQKLGSQIPLQLEFRDANGALSNFGKLLDARPTVLVPGYFACPNLCAAVRGGVAHALIHTGFAPGKQFNVILFSINPHETSIDAATTQRETEKSFPRADVANWKFLTASPRAITAITDAIGFRYLFDPRNNQFDHAAGIVVLTPQGKIAQYLFGAAFDAQTLRLALVNASHGTIGNVIDQLWLLCCNYDYSTGRYSLAIHRIMQGLGISFALALVIWIVFALRRGEITK